MGHLPPPTGSRFGMVCPLSILGTPFRSKRGAVSISRRETGREKGAIWTELLVVLVYQSAAFWSRSSVSPSAPPSQLYLPNTSRCF